MRRRESERSGDALFIYQRRGINFLQSVSWRGVGYAWYIATKGRGLSTLCCPPCLRPKCRRCHWKLITCLNTHTYNHLLPRLYSSIYRTLFLAEEPAEKPALGKYRKLIIRVHYRLFPTTDHASTPPHHGFSFPSALPSIQLAQEMGVAAI